MVKEKSNFTKIVININKRILDIISSIFGLILLSPFFLLLSIMIRRDSPGPAFFRCNRIGKGGKPFKMLKFRTMYEDPKSYQGPPVTCEGDERITPLGHWLRDTKINELPQLWNVLIGEMSLVGPRPEDVDIAREWPEDVFKEVLSVRPGITSPASILYHNEETLLSRENLMEEYFKDILPNKIRLDQLYVRNHSFSADLDTIFWTIAIFIPRIARSKIPENLLFFGPISHLLHRYLNWFFIDLVVALISVSFVSFLWRLQIPLNWGINYLAIFAVALALLFAGINTITGLKRILWSRATANDALSLMLSSSMVTLLVLVVNYLQSFFNWFDIPPLPVFMLLTIGVLTQIGFIAVRFRFRLFTAFASRWMNFRQRSLGVGERVLIVGLGDGFENAVWQFRRGEYGQIFSIVGVVDDNPMIVGMVVNDCRVLGKINEIPEIIEKFDIGVLVFTQTQIESKLRRQIQKISKTTGLKIAFIHELNEILNKQINQTDSIPDQLLWSTDRLKYLVTYDTVTGLPNQFLFNEHLRHSLAIAHRNKSTTAVMLVTVNGWKEHNQMMQDENQELLKRAASRLSQHKRDCDTLAYLDNWEFGLILENISKTENVNLVARRINQSFEDPIHLNGNQYKLSPKINVCTDLDGFFDPLNDSDQKMNIIQRQSEEVN